MTTREVIQGELGLAKIRSRRIMLRLRFWVKILKMRGSKRLVYQIYQQRRKDFLKVKKPDTKNWCYWTWRHLRDLQLEHIWESENVESEKEFNQIVRLIEKERRRRVERKQRRKRS